MTKIHDDGTRDEDGLSATECEYLKTPVSKLNQDQRMIATSIFAKRAEARYAANAEYRKAQQDERAKKLSAAA